MGWAAYHGTSPVGTNQTTRTDSSSPTTEAGALLGVRGQMSAAAFQYINLLGSLLWLYFMGTEWSIHVHIGRNKEVTSNDGSIIPLSAAGWMIKDYHPFAG